MQNSTRRVERLFEGIKCHDDLALFQHLPAFLSRI